MCRRTRKSIEARRKGRSRKRRTPRRLRNNVAVKAGDTETFFSWMEVPGAISYNLYFNTSPTLTDSKRNENRRRDQSLYPYRTDERHALLLCRDGGVRRRCRERTVGQVTATPVLIDITAPQNAYAVMNHGAFMTNSPEVVVTISANDIDTGVGAYYVSEAPMTPMAGTPGWVDVTPGTEVRRDDSLHSLSGRRPEDDFCLVQRRRRQCVHAGERHHSGEYVGLSLRVEVGTTRPGRVAAAWRRVHGADLRSLCGPAGLDVRRG